MLFKVWCISLIFGLSILWNWNVCCVVKWILLYRVCLVVNLLIVSYWWGVMIFFGICVWSMILCKGLSFCLLCLVWILWLFCWYMLWKWMSWKLFVVKLLVMWFCRFCLIVLCRKWFLCFRCLLFDYGLSILLSIFCIDGFWFVFISRYFFDNVLFYVVYLYIF